MVPNAAPGHLTLLGAIVDRPPLNDPAVVPEKIPWDDPAFSERMLAEHLDQSHDMASRRIDIVDRHIAWIFETVMDGRPGKVLDVGCGPGLYTERLAARGCTCRGVDFSPASVRHARTISAESGSACTYFLGDVRTTDFGETHDIALLLFGEFNVFDTTEGPDLLARVGRALRPGGRLVLEPQPEDAVRAAAAGPPTWFAARSGLFSPEPHLVLTEHAWADTAGCTLTRHLVIDAATASVVTYGERVYAYSVGDYRAVLAGAGFVDVEIHDGFGATTQPGTIVITARTPAE